MKKIKLIFWVSLALLLASCGGESTATTKSKVKTATSKVVSTPTKIPQKIQTSSATVTISGKDMEVTSGAEFCMDVEVSGFVDVISMQYSTNWDAKALQYIGVKNPTLQDLSTDKGANFGQAPKEENALRLLWFTKDKDLKGVTLYDHSPIYQVCFNAIGKSGTTTEVKFSNKPIVAEVADSKMQRMKVELKSAKIKIN